MDSVLETTMQTILGFCVLLLLTRFLDKKQLGQLTYFTYITGIAMGNITGAENHSFSCDQNPIHVRKQFLQEQKE